MEFYQGLMQNGIYSLTHSAGLRSVVFKKTVEEIAEDQGGKGGKGSKGGNDGDEDKADDKDSKSNGPRCDKTANPSSIPG